MSYGKSYEKYPINEGEIWNCNESSIAVCDLTKSLPEFMLHADMLYCDPPWSLGNVNMFNSKAGREYMNSFNEFYDSLFENIKKIAPEVCYLEIGEKNRELYIQKLSELYPVVQDWQITYYKKNKCYLLRAAQSPTDFDFSNYDDEETPALAVKNESPRVVGDLCTGRGLTGIAALTNNCSFVGTELNKRKLAVFIERAKRKGYEFAKEI